MKKIIMMSLSALLLMTGCSSGSAAVDDAQEENGENTEETTETVALDNEAEETELETMDVTRKVPASAFEGTYISTGAFMTPYEPSVMFFRDGTFIFTANFLEGMCTYIGTYEYDKSGIRCKAETESSYGKEYESDKEILFSFISDWQLELESDVSASIPGERFVYVNQFRAPGTYVSTVEDYFVAGYEPTVTFNDDGTFVMTENLLSGMGEYKGLYQYDGNRYHCIVQSVSFSGYKGQDVKDISFSVNGKNVVLSTDLCASTSGNVFTESETASKPEPEPTPETKPEASTERKGTVFIVANADSNRIKVREKPGLSGKDTGERKYSGERVTVYEETVKDSYTWYRIGKDRWMAGNGTSFGIKFD